MTKDEAKKILDFLYRRFEKNAVKIAQPFVQSEMHVLGINVKSFNRYLVLEFDWHNVDPKLNLSNHEFIWTLYDDNFNASFNDDAIQFKYALTDQNIVDCLFGLAQTMNIAIPMWISKAIYMPFIYKGETSEEILIKSRSGGDQ